VKAVIELWVPLFNHRPGQDGPGRCSSAFMSTGVSRSQDVMPYIGSG
jgi:hypothetical protein